MGSVLSWAANSVLFVVGCFLAADTANEVIAAIWLAPAPEISAPAPIARDARERSWSERQIILSRNLFNSSTVVAAPPPEEVLEDIEKSRLPVTLLGTFAATDSALSRATLQDREKNETLVVGVGDQIKGKALVTRIERRRVILTENGAPRELTLDDDSLQVSTSVRRARTARRSPARARARGAERNPLRKVSDNVMAVDRDEIAKTIRNPSTLLSQARVLPKFEDGQMVGLQVNAIKSGSLLEEIGLKNGDVITELNGIEITSPEEGNQILQELADAEEYNVVVKSSDGSERPLPTFVPE